MTKNEYLNSSGFFLRTSFVIVNDFEPLAALRVTSGAQQIFGPLSSRQWKKRRFEVQRVSQIWSPDTKASVCIPLYLATKSLDVTTGTAL